MCRCGVERKQLEALGYTFDTPWGLAAPDVVSPPAKSTAVRGVTGLLLGYRSDAHISGAWRIVLSVVFIALVGGAGYGIVTSTHTPLPATRENVEIVATLETHAKGDSTSSGNTIPSFLTLPGTVGVVEPTMTRTDLLKTMSAEDLMKGFCSPSIARQIRYEYPGFYETWPDDKLERLALEKYPEFQDRVCILPSQLGVSPDDVVKYQIRSRTILELARLWLRTIAMVGAFAVALLNVYYRLLVDRFAAA